MRDPAAAERLVRERGKRRCLTCGKPHDCLIDPERPAYYGSWADPDDGHIYRAETPTQTRDRYARALGQIVNALGPDHVLNCADNKCDGCKAEASEALRLAQEALA